MEEEKDVIFNIIEQASIRIENIYCLETNLDFQEINQNLVKEKYSVLVMKNDYLLIDGEENKLVEIENYTCEGLLGELNVPKYKFNILTKENIYLFFESCGSNSLKNIIKKSGHRLEERLILKYYDYLIQQIDILHCNGFVHGNLNPNNIIIFSKNDGIMILDAFMSTSEKLENESVVKIMKILKDYTYSSPEDILSSRSPKKEDDYWSIGMILVEMCLGEIPFDIDEYFSITKEKIEKLFKEWNYTQEIVEIIIDLLINKKIHTNRKKIDVSIKKENKYIWKTSMKAKKRWKDRIRLSRNV